MSCGKKFIHFYRNFPCFYANGYVIRKLLLSVIEIQKALRGSCVLRTLFYQSEFLFILMVFTSCYLFMTRGDTAEILPQWILGIQLGVISNLFIFVNISILYLKGWLSNCLVLGHVTVLILTLLLRCFWKVSTFCGRRVVLCDGLLVQFSCEIITPQPLGKFLI